MRRKRRQKSFAEVAYLQGTEFYLSDSGVYLYWEDSMADRQIFLEDLLNKYYKINWEQPPLVIQLMDDSHGGLPEKVWYCIMRGNFYVEVIKGRNIDGPHQVKLWFKSFTTKQTFWIATLQLMAFFFNETEVKDGILRATAEGEFFMLPNNRKKAIIP